MSTLFTLEQKDFAKGLITALFASALAVIYSLVQAPDFSLFSADWGQIGANVANVCSITFISYLAKNFLSDSKGDFLGNGDEV